MRRQSRLPTRGEREGREDQTAGQHARAAHSSDPSEAADGPTISICWNSFRSPFRVSPSSKSSPRRSGLPHSASKSEGFTIFRKLQSAFLIATSSALAVLRLWNSDGPNLDYGRFRERITGTRRL